jgi:uncharacterized protein (UPF0147 family)
MSVNLRSCVIGVAFFLGMNAIALSMNAETKPFSEQNIVGRWQVKFPTADGINPDVEVAITADGRVFYLDKVKGEAIEIMTLLEKVSDQSTIPDNIKIIDIQAQAKAEAIARQAKRIQTEAQTVFSTIHKSQQEYFAKNNQFGSKLEDLGFGEEIKSEVFNYKIEAIAPKFIVQAVAFNKDRAAANSTFIAITYLTQVPTGETAIASLICQGNQKAEQFTPRARFIKVGNFIKDIKCPAGFTPISR